MSKLTIDYDAFGTEILCADFMVEEMRRRAHLVYERAVVLAAPHYDPEDKSGAHYITQFRLESGVRQHKTSRAYGEVINDDPAAIDIEYGTRETPKQRILGRALDAAGP